MKRKSALLLCLLACLSMGACAITQIQPTPQRIFSETQTAYLNAWNSYHAVWLALPETDARKTEWVKEYHPKFLAAADLLQKFSNFPTATNEELLTKALNECETILIQLAIKKGAK